MVSDIVKLRVWENEEKIAAKKKAVKASSNTSISAEALMNTNKKKPKPQKITDEEQVNNWLDKLDPAVMEEINAV